MSKSQRAKGAAAEREIAALMTDHFGQIVKRKLGAARDGGDDIEVGPFSIEVKRRAKIAVTAFMEQAWENCGDKTPVVMMREDGGQWLVMFPAEAAFKLMRNEL